MVLQVVLRQKTILSVKNIAHTIVRAGDNTHDIPSQTSQSKKLNFRTWSWYLTRSLDLIRDLGTRSKHKHTEMNYYFLLKSVYKTKPYLKFLWPLSFQGFCKITVKAGFHQQRSQSRNQKHKTLRSSEKSILDLMIPLTTPSFAIKWKLGNRSCKHKAWERVLWLVYPSASASDSNNLDFTRS